MPVVAGLSSGAPGRIRTFDPQIRRLMLYAELEREPSPQLRFVAVQKFAAMIRRGLNLCYPAAVDWQRQMPTPIGAA